MGYPQPLQDRNLQKYFVKLVSKGGLKQPLRVVFRVSWSGAKRKKICLELTIRVSRYRSVPDASGPFLNPLLAVCLQNDTPFPPRFRPGVFDASPTVI
jgi:hypothetical protein